MELPEKIELLFRHAGNLAKSNRKFGVHEKSHEEHEAAQIHLKVCLKCTDMANQEYLKHFSNAPEWPEAFPATKFIEEQIAHLQAILDLLNEDRELFGLVLETYGPKGLQFLVDDPLYHRLFLFGGNFSEKRAYLINLCNTFGAMHSQSGLKEEMLAKAEEAVQYITIEDWSVPKVSSWAKTSNRVKRLLKEIFADKKPQLGRNYPPTAIRIMQKLVKGMDWEDGQIAEILDLSRETVNRRKNHFR